MNLKITSIGTALAVIIFSPGIANASFVLDTGNPTGSGAPQVLSSTQWAAGEFSVTAGEDITSLAAYLTQGAGQPNDTFTFDIYSSSGFTNRANTRPAPVFAATGTFLANGWNTTAVNWTPTTTGTYWLALQVSSPTNTKGLDLPAESGAATGTAPAIAFAYAPSSGQYTITGATPIGLQITAAAPVPLPAALWLLGSGLAGLGAMRRRRQGQTIP